MLVWRLLRSIYSMGRTADMTTGTMIGIDLAQERFPDAQSLDDRAGTIQQEVIKATISQVYGGASFRQPPICPSRHED
jgi:hypothetical protein